jgi:hypothetical protein
LLGVTAYTELRSDGSEDDEPAIDVGMSGRSDAAVAALARAVEAMQRVQAERERAQAERERAQSEMLARLIERLAPPPPVVARNAPDVLREFSEMQKVIKKLAPEGEAESASGGSPMTALAAVIEQVAAAVMPLLQQKLAGIGAAASESQGANDVRKPENIAAAKGGSATAQAETVTSLDRRDGEAVEKKLEAVFALLTAEEAVQVRRMSERMPASVLEQGTRLLMAMTPEEAAAEIRRQFFGGHGGSAKPADGSEEKGSNGTPSPGGG